MDVRYQGRDDPAAPPSHSDTEIDDAEPILATERMPPELQDALSKDSGVFIRSLDEPALNLTVERVAGTPDIWRVRGSEMLLTGIPGQHQAAADPSESGPALADVDTPGFRPSWVDVESVPRLVPFRAGVGGTGREHLFHEPRPRRVRTTEAKESPTLPFPFRTVGKVFARGGPNGPEGGTGVLVGPNLVLTAGHLAPWGARPGEWSMEFIPGLRPGQRPFGQSFVDRFHGFRTEPEASGLDYVICRLFQPMGSSLGFMGTQSFGDESRYEELRYSSLGYPDAFGLRQALESIIRIADIDNDSPGLELEVPHSHPLGPGWSGGPLFFGPNSNPRVVGVLSGSEKDVLDPRRWVFAGGKALVDLVKFGLANFPP